MNSYDYCHFEVALETELKGEQPRIKVNKTADLIRKDAQRLVDKAIQQYKIAKQKATGRAVLSSEKKKLTLEVNEIEKVPEKERTSEQKAKVKALQDHDHWEQHNYDYEDDADQNGIPF